MAYLFPNAPSSLTCTAVSSSQIDLSWQDNSGNEDGFKIERKKVGESFSLIYTTGANITSYSDTGIEANTTYYYRVHAYNTAGDSAYSNEAFDTTQVLVATAVSYDQIDLTWRDYFDNEDGFKIERRKVGESFSLIYTTGENVTAWSNIGIDVNTTYYYRVYAYNATADSVYSNESSATTFSLFTNFLVDEPVYAVVIDSSGGKWFGTGWRGVSYLDDNGTPDNKSDDAWTSFTTADGLVNNRVNTIAIDSSGGKWFGTGGGVSYLDDNGTPDNKSDDTWTSFTTADGLVNNRINAAAINSSGGKWFGTGDGVSYFDDNGTPDNKADDTWTSFTTADGLVHRWVHAIAIDSGGGTWFATDWGGVSFFDDNGTPDNKLDDTWTSFTTADGLVDSRVRAVAIDSGGGKWFATDWWGVSYLDDNGTPDNKTDDTWTSFTRDNVPFYTQIYAIAIDSGGGKWFATGAPSFQMGGGVRYLDDNGTPDNKADDTWISFKTDDGLVHDRVNAVAIDTGGGKWFGTGDGVSYLDDNGTPDNKADDTWTSFTNTDGLVDYRVISMAIDLGGGKWFGTGDSLSYLDDNGTVDNYSDDTWASFSTADGLIHRWVHAMAIDSGGGKWFGTRGVNYLDDNSTPDNKSDDTWTSFTTTDGLVSNLVHAIAIDSSGGKWFATGSVNYLDDNGTPDNKLDDTWTYFTTADGLVSNAVHAITIDSGGGKWFGTGGGVSYLDDNDTPDNKSDDTWTSFTTADGLVDKRVNAIAIDSGGGKWFGTNDGASYFDDNGTPTNKTDDTWGSLPFGEVTTIAIDLGGGKWFGYWGGVSYLP